jgi:hypothetical protein
LGRRRVIESIPNKIKRLASEWIRTVTEAMGAPSGIASKHAVTIIESRRKK